MKALIGGALLLAATVSTAEAQCYLDTIDRDPMGNTYWACRAREEQQQQQRMQQEIERHNREQIMRDQLEEQRRQNRMRQDEEMQREIFRKR
jgi:hypothetical protein